MACAWVADEAAARRPSRRDCQPRSASAATRRAPAGRSAGPRARCSGRRPRRQIRHPEGASRVAAARRRLPRALPGAGGRAPRPPPPPRKLEQGPMVIDRLLALGAAHVHGACPTHDVWDIGRREDADHRDRLAVASRISATNGGSGSTCAPITLPKCDWRSSRCGLAQPCTVPLSATPSRTHPPSVLASEPTAAPNRGAFGRSCLRSTRRSSPCWTSSSRAG